MANDSNDNSGKEPLLNTAWGLLPWLFFVVSQNFISYKNALILGFATWGLFILIFSYFKRNLTLAIPLNVSCGALVVQALCLLLPIKQEYTTIFCEIILIIFLWVFDHSKKFVKRYYLRKETAYSNSSKVVALSELFFVARIYLDTLFIHLTIAFIFFLVPEEYHTAGLNRFIYNQLGIILLLLVIIYEHIRLRLIKRKLSGEDWLPVVNDSGRVIGKVARSVSFKSKNQFLHPLVRIALINKGMLYLMERPSYYIQDPSKIDHPFEEYLRYGQDLDQAVNDIIRVRSKAENLQTRFVFKYLYKNATTNRLIYLYTIPVHDEETMSKIQLKSGKLWTEKQIEENLDKGIFSECFEKEYDILKNTILMAEKMVIQS